MVKVDHPSDHAYTSAAWFLDCEPRALKAIAKVEAGPEGAFLESGEPVILFERHLFHRFTLGRFETERLEGTAIDEWGWLSRTTPGGYGPVSLQHKKLAAAVALDREAALRACSWGLFQILGTNHASAGHATLREFVNAMYRSVDDHLRALVMFIRNDRELLDALRGKDWTAFARAYNGPQFERNQYDEKMADAYKSLADMMETGEA